MSFDSLTFARRLKAAGFSDSQAEALADANREMVIHDTATKDDLTSLRTDLKSDIATLRTDLKSDIATLRTDLKSDIATLRTELKADITSLRTELNADITSLKADTAAVKQRLLSAIENQTLRLTVRLGIMLAAGLSLITALLGALIKFH